MANTTKKRATELEKEIAATLTACPDPMSRTDFRKACHIGTRTSLYLLQSGLVPCRNTGKRTRCYQIAKADVADYLRRRAADPARYTPPSGWYKNYPHHKPPENAHLPGAQGLAAGLPVFGRLQQHLPQKPEAQPDGTGDAGIVKSANE